MGEDSAEMCTAQECVVAGATWGAWVGWGGRGVGWDTEERKGRIAALAVKSSPISACRQAVESSHDELEKVGREEEE